MHPQSVPDAGWYPDPHQPHQLRWWDGDAWTDHIQQLEPGLNPTDEDARRAGGEEQAVPSTEPGPAAPARIPARDSSEPDEPGRRRRQPKDKRVLPLDGVEEVTVRKFQSVSIELRSAVDAVRNTISDQGVIALGGLFGVTFAVAVGGAFATFAGSGSARVFLGRDALSGSLIGAFLGWMITCALASLAVGWWSAASGNISLRYQAGLRPLTVNEAAQAGARDLFNVAKCWLPLGGVVAVALMLRVLLPGGLGLLMPLVGAGGAAYLLGRLSLAAPLVSFTSRAVEVAWRLGGAWREASAARGAIGVSMIAGPVLLLGEGGPAGWVLGGAIGLTVGVPLWAAFGGAMLLDTLSPTRGQVDTATR